MAAAGTASAWLLDPFFGRVTYLVPIGLITGLALLAGTGPALLATGLTALGLWQLVYPGLVLAEDPQTARLLATFTLLAAMLSAVAGAQRRTRSQLARSAEAAAQRAREARSGEEQLRRSEEQRRLALQAAELGTWRYDADTGEASWDERFQAIHGLGVPGLPYRDFVSSVVHPDDRERFDAVLRRALDPREAAREVVELDYRVLGPAGEVRWVRARGEASFEAVGGRRRARPFVGTAADVTSRKRAEEELRRANEELQASQERYRLVSLATRDVVWDWDPASGHLAWNEAIETAFGYRLDEIEPDFEWWRDRVHPDDRQPVVDSLQAAIDRPEVSSWQAEYRFLHARGHWLHVLDRGHISRDARGRPVRAIGSMLDQTEQKRAEEALRRSKDEFRSLADAMPQLVWISRPDGSAEFFNRNWCDYTGSTVETAGGDTWMRLLHPEDQERTRARWHHSLEAGAPYEVEYRLRSAQDGRYHWFLARAAPVVEGSRVVRWFGTCTDIDEKKKAEAALRDEKRRLDVVLASLPVGVFIADRDGTLVGINEEAKRIWGRPPPTRGIAGYAEYQGWWTGTHKKLAARDWAMARALEHGETVSGETIDILRFDGTCGTILNSAAPFRDDAGNITGGVVAVVDITAQRKAQEALRRSEERARDRYAELEQIYRVAPVGLFTMDRECRFQRINERMAQLTGRAIEEHLGRTLEDIVPDLADFLRERLRPVLEEGRPVVGLEVHGATPGAPGVQRDFTGNFFPLTSGAGEVVGLVGAVLEVTARRRAEAALQQANERLLEADHRKNEFLAVLSHELRNPLAPIRNSLYVLERAAPGGPQARRAHEVIERQVRHMARLIDDLLDVTRVSRGKIHLQRERVELGELVRRTAEDHRTLFSESGVSLEVATGAVPLWARGDPTRLAQVVGNLLTNAAKFTSRGGHVRLWLDSDGGQAEFHVRDDGAGISAPILERLFQPFVQADATLDRSKGGLGLGLALVKGLAELHGGSVSARSAGPGTGAEFVVRLPLEPAAREAPPRDQEGPAPAGPLALRILLVEDNPDAAQSLKEVLELDGQEVHLAATGPEGIEQARALRPDVVLCDIGLPGVDGYEVARRLRADPQLHDTPLVALSGYAGPEDLGRAREAGFVRHLAKPPDIGKLEATLVEVGARRRAAPGMATRAPGPR